MLLEFEGRTDTAVPRVFSDALSLTRVTRERVRVWVASRFKYYASHRHRRTIASRRYAYDRLHPHPPRDLQEQITRRPLPACACGHVRKRGRGYFSALSDHGEGWGAGADAAPRTSGFVWRHNQTPALPSCSGLGLIGAPAHLIDYAARGGLQSVDQAVSGEG